MMAAALRIAETAARQTYRTWHACVALLICLVLVAPALAHADPLPSWRDGPAKRAIVAFVAAVTTPGSKDYVPPAERIATFDNDGTLWSEQPLYFQGMFMIDQVQAQAPKHPEWQDQAAFKALMANDHKALAELGHKPVLELLAAANSGMTVEEYGHRIASWLASARHPRFQRPYNELVYAPMQELLRYLRAHGFKTFIVSGGGIEFMRAWAEQAYDIPPEQVTGSVAEVRFELRDGAAVLVREPKTAFIDDGPGKPEGIYRAIGQRPLAAFGNSDGDLQMLQYTAAGPGQRLALLVHHDDAAREYAYDRTSHVGKLDKALDEAVQRNWVVVSMKNDWARVYPFQSRAGAVR